MLIGHRVLGLDQPSEAWPETVVIHVLRAKRRKIGDEAQANGVRPHLQPSAPRFGSFGRFKVRPIAWCGLTPRSAFAYLQTDAGLAELAKLVEGIGSTIGSSVTGKSAAERRGTDLAARARRGGLKSHPYTLRTNSPIASPPSTNSWPPSSQKPRSTVSLPTSPTSP